MIEQELPGRSDTKSRGHGGEETGVSPVERGGGREEALFRTKSTARASEDARDGSDGNFVTRFRHG